MSDTIVRELRLRRFEAPQPGSSQPAAERAGQRAALVRDPQPGQAATAQLGLRHSRRRPREL